MTTSTRSLLISLILAGLVFVGVSFAVAAPVPTAPPTSGNPPPPLHQSVTAQYKAGPLALGIGAPAAGRMLDSNGAWYLNGALGVTNQGVVSGNLVAGTTQPFAQALAVDGKMMVSSLQNGQTLPVCADNNGVLFVSSTCTAIHGDTVKVSKPGNICNPAIEDCGTGTPVPECSDGIDNDGDGFVDYPEDPGCSSPDDEFEQNKGLPTIPTCSKKGETNCTTEPTNPQCSDGIDNDFDGLYDYPDDPGCTSPTDPSEVDEPVTTDRCQLGYVFNPKTNTCEQTIAATDELVCQYDLTFVLDRSGSIDATEGADVGTFLSTVLDDYLRPHIENEEIAVSIVAFANSAGASFPLSTGVGTTDAALGTVADRFSGAGGGGTNINAGYCVADQQYDVASRGAEYPRKVILLTDGADLAKSECNPDFYFTGSGYSVATAQFEKTRDEIIANDIESLVIGINPAEVRPNLLTQQGTIDRWNLIHTDSANGGDAFWTEDFSGITDPAFIEDIFLSTCETVATCPDGYVDNKDGTCTQSVGLIRDPLAPKPRTDIGTTSTATAQSLQQMQVIPVRNETKNFLDRINPFNLGR